MFTKGQKEVMDFTLSPFSIRGNLWSASNLALTGTRDEDVANPVTCVPIPDFAIQPITTSNKRMVCVGNSVTFSNISYNAETYTRAWTFEGGTPGTSTATSPQVSYDLPGLFDVSLAATNTVGSATETKPDYILVSPDEAQFGSGPFLEDFNQDADFNNWVVYNNDTTASKWEYVGNGIGFGGGGSAVMRNYTNVYGEKDELISPSYNISSIPNPVLMFRIAGAERGAPEPTPPAAAPIPDVLNLYTSSNCGQSWTLRTNWDGQELASAGQYNSAFVPTSADQWKAIYYPLSSGIANQDNMRFKFEYVAGQFRTNNFYIDDINIGTALGVENLENEIGLRLFPNPVSSSTLIQFSIGYSTDIRIAVIDMLGKEVFVPYTGKVAGGEQAFNIDMSSLSAGIYTIRVELDGRGIHKKVIKN